MSLDGEIYLDWNATTPPHPDVVDAMAGAARHGWGNPSSTHRTGRAARATVEDAREAVARLLDVDSRDVFIVSGGTEANNLALRGAVGLVVSRLEHPSVTRVAEEMAERGVPVEWLAVPPSGRIAAGHVEDALGRLPRGSTVALMAANHETGVLQPIAEVAEIASRAAARLHVDAVQAVGKVDPAAWRGASSLSLAAHKIRGPKGIGALAFVGAPPQPVLFGGAQERGVRPGTTDPVAAAGLAVAAERARGGPARHARLQHLRNRVEKELEGLAVVNGDQPRLPHVTNLSVEGWKGDELVAALDLDGVRVSSGSACSAGTTEASPIISAMLGERRAATAIRVSLGETTSPDDVERAIVVMKERVTRHPSPP